MLLLCCQTLQLTPNAFHHLLIHLSKRLDYNGFGDRINLVHTNFAWTVERPLFEIIGRDRKTVIGFNGIGCHCHNNQVRRFLVVDVVGDNNHRPPFLDERSVNGIGTSRISPCSGIVPVLVIQWIVPKVGTAL
ncbi:MAG: hypothetical protein PGMFKBFP_01789 [Anaerolineales bacterium]|nr:hypothetical protein [Anaerolineales bacterium]